MVQNEASNSGDESFIIENPAKGIPVGKYRLVGWGIDTTGRRLIDEICQIAAYSPNSDFSQYIMPFSDINPFYSRKHSIRVINTERYRMLKNMRTNRFVKTKSDICAVTDFIHWLEENKGEADGIILIFYEIRKSSPSLLLEVLRRFNLLERFSKIVKGFANCFNIVQAKCGKTTTSFSLRVMSKVLLNKDNEDFSSAVDRARVSYQIAAHLVQGEREDLAEKDEKKLSTSIEPELIEFVCPFVNPIPDEEDEIIKLKGLLEIQNSFRPVFGALLRASKSERVHAAHLRRLLAQNNINYDKLKDVYEAEAKDGLDKVLKTEVTNANETELKDLLDILDCFFDPQKKAVRPKQRYYNNRRPRQTRNSVSRDKRSSNSSNSPNVSSNINEQVSGEKVEPETEEKTVEVQ